MNRYEKKYRDKGFIRIAGIDEAGRGPLAGPVVAAAVILPENHGIIGLADSKKLSQHQREDLYYQIRQKALGIGKGFVDSDRIDRINILQATRLAMKQAVRSLIKQPDFLFIDGITMIESAIKQLTIIRGDGRSESIAAASIVAKVDRDRMMRGYDKIYPSYLFSKHKGYGTREHRERIRRFGPSPIHRKTFRGVREYLS